MVHWTQFWEPSVTENFFRGCIRFLNYKPKYTHYSTTTQLYTHSTTNTHELSTEFEKPYQKQIVKINKELASSSYKQTHLPPYDANIDRKKKICNSRFMSVKPESKCQCRRIRETTEAKAFLWANYTSKSHNPPQNEQFSKSDSLITFHHKRWHVRWFSICTPWKDLFKFYRNANWLSWKQLTSHKKLIPANTLLVFRVVKFLPRGSFGSFKLQITGTEFYEIWKGFGSDHGSFGWEINIVNWITL